MYRNIGIYEKEEFVRLRSAYDDSGAVGLLVI